MNDPLKTLLSAATTLGADVTFTFAGPDACEGMSVTVVAPGLRRAAARAENVLELPALCREACDALFASLRDRYSPPPAVTATMALLRSAAAPDDAPEQIT